jgi:alkaline phosphatase
LKVILGGGSRNFINATEPAHRAMGRRTDGRNLINEWLAKSPSTRTYVSNRTQLMDIDTATYDGQLFGMFHATHTNFNLDTIRLNRQAENPTLPEMTKVAIELLSKDENGFFLLVESGRIDHGHHGTQARLAIDETFEFDKSIRQALEMVDLEETLVIVTADHSHVFTYGGYPHRGNDIFGLSPSSTQDGMPFLT